MEQPHTPSIKELKEELEHIDERTREKCLLCRIVLGLSIAIFLVVSIYALTQFYKKHYGFKTIPLAPNLYPPVDPAVTNRELIELGQLFHPELSTTTPVHSFASSTLENKSRSIKQ